ncbi:hypothetical protein ACPCA8_34330 [Streptomyces capoamus]|uniref:hypothetical protein n=1 Tax=Streptomyces capoamus TaxID=68183 RepID=UPI003C2D03DA
MSSGSRHCPVTELGDVAGWHVVAESYDPHWVAPDSPVLGGVDIDLRDQSGLDKTDVSEWRLG